MQSKLKAPPMPGTKKEKPPFVEVAPGSAVKPVEYNPHETQGCAPFDRFDHLAHFLEGNPHCYTPGVLKELRKIVEQYEGMVGDKKTATVNVDDAAARQALNIAHERIAGAIAGFQLAAQMMMAVDFKKGLNLAKQAEELSVLSIRFKVEGV